MSARDAILAKIKAHQSPPVSAPPNYRAPMPPDLETRFRERARFANAEVRTVDNEAAVPAAIAELLRARNLPAVVHVPASALTLPWETVPGLTVNMSRPTGEDSAVARAPFGIAETGTLAYLSDPERPASWHFRAGFEIAVLHAKNILPHMEDIIDAAKRAGRLPSTINFVTGPSRTGDIEQTLELGAHGPKALAILIVADD